MIGSMEIQKCKMRQCCLRGPHLAHCAVAAARHGEVIVTISLLGVGLDAGTDRLVPESNEGLSVTRPQRWV